MMRIFHTADLHAKSSRADEVLTSLMKLEQDAELDPPDLITISGDIWDGPISNTEKSFFPVFVEAIRQLADISPVVIVYGTPSHDISGSLEIFETLNTIHGITILKPGVPYFLSMIDQRVYAHHEAKGEDNSKLLIFGVPEPGKEWLNANENGASEEALEEGIQTLFLGLGNLRKQFEKIPCILLYHGQVRGARLQNKERLETGVSIEDLKVVDADYIALGDIHEPQQIGDLAAYYPGSVYPGNFGETHQSGYNLVTINTGSPDPFLFSNSCCDVKVERVDFPHPQRCHETVTVDKFLPNNLENVRNKVAWVEVKDRRERLSEINPETATEWIISECGALPGSKVTLSPLPTETVRAAEITEVKSLREKVKIYAEASGQEIDEETLHLADQLESLAIAMGDTGTGTSIQIQKLGLRGSIGIWKGQRKDEVWLDFSKHDTGLIALIGKNGAGKTTLIENMHVWPQMLTREGKLQDHFRLRDSFRDLYFRDTRTGTEYRAFLKIDGKNTSGSVEYFMYENIEGEWQPLAGINGRQAPYMEWTTKLWGSISLYLRSAFSTQRPSKSAPDLASSVRGARRALFGELAGIDYLQGYADAAKDKAKAIDADILTETGKITAIEQQVAVLPEKQEALCTGNKLIQEELAKKDQAKKNKIMADANLRDFEGRRQQSIEIKSKIDAKEERLKTVNASISDADQEQLSFSTALKDRDSAESKVKEWEVLDGELKQLQEGRRQYEDEFQKQYSQWADSDKTFRNARQAVLDEITTTEKARSSLEADRKVLAAESERLEDELRIPIDEHCPTCGQLWPEDKLLEYRNARAEKNALADVKAEELVQLNQNIKKLDTYISEQRQKLTDLGKETPPPEKAEFRGSARINEIENNLDFIDIDAARETLEKAREAQLHIAEIQKRIQILREEKQQLESEYLDLKQQYTPGVEDDYQKAKKWVEDTQETIQECERKLSGYEARHKELEHQIADLLSRESEISRIKVEIEKNRTLQKRWQFLQLACGRDGIQALELDALAPSITEIANRLLSAAYGSRFQVEIRTTRMSGTGSKTKQIEDFDIWVIDIENMDEQTLDTLSGGEAVWIRKALDDAFGIVRTRNTGMAFRTVFLDEADGALDPDAREHYFRMLEAAHAESNRQHTVLITHSREIQEIIRQKIDICDLSAPEKEQAAA